MCFSRVLNAHTHTHAPRTSHCEINRTASEVRWLHSKESRLVYLRAQRIFDKQIWWIDVNMWWRQTITCRSMQPECVIYRIIYSFNKSLESAFFFVFDRQSKEIILSLMEQEDCSLLIRPLFHKDCVSEPATDEEHRDWMHFTLFLRKHIWFSDKRQTQT